MQEKNIMGLIQDVKDYFLKEHELSVQIRIKSHTSENKQDCFELLEIAQKIQAHIGGRLRVDGGKVTNWVKVDNWDSGIEVTFFYNEEVQA